MTGRERWGILMRPEDPLAQREAVSAKDLESLPLIQIYRVHEMLFKHKFLITIRYLICWITYFIMQVWKV